MERRRPLRSGSLSSCWKGMTELKTALPRWRRLPELWRRLLRSGLWLLWPAGQRLESEQLLSSGSSVCVLPKLSEERRQAADRRVETQHNLRIGQTVPGENIVCNIVGEQELQQLRNRPVINRWGVWDDTFACQARASTERRSPLVVDGFL